MEAGHLVNLIEVTQEHGTDLLAITEGRWLGKRILEMRIILVWCIAAVMINSIVLEWVLLSVNI
jgi:hypothetical protein